MARIALNIIAKNEQDKILKIISDYDKYFDEICLAIDDKGVYKHLKNADNKKIKAYHYTHKNQDGLLDFAHKRNFLKEKTKSDYIFRLDTDDTIKNPERIKEIVEYMEDENIQVITCMYDYSKDEWGNHNAVHYRETIIENTPNVFWNMPIHECILPKNPYNFNIASNDTLKIIHNIDKDHSVKSAKRNLVYLVNEFNRDKDKTDPRTLGYLARTLHGLGDFKKAVYFYEQHIKKSGWSDDRYLSWCQLGTIFKALNDNEKAKACAFEALQEKADFPDAYFLLHDIYFNEDKWRQSLEWAEMGFKKPFPKTNIFLDPSSYTWRPMLSTAECYFKLGDFEKAAKIFDSAKKFISNHEYIKTAERVYREALEHSRFVSKFTWLLNFINDKEPKKAKSLIDAIPKELYQHELISRIRNQYIEPKKWGKDEITIFCGGTPMDWSPKSVEKGIGGSEEAVIYLSQELNKIGYKVTVYNCCGEDEGNYNGVEWKNIVNFNSRDSFNILISWRANMFVYNIQARNKIVWIHDLPNQAEWSEDSVRTVDRVIVLSHYHASLLPDCVPKEKIYISTNGIKAEDFAEIKEKRNPHRIIYASSYDRGLEEMLEMWGDVKKEVPDAELHIFYGWNIYDEYVKRGLVKDDGFKARMLKLMTQDGVFEHGRVGHKELIKEYAKSGIYAYYCTYRGEINCIALTKAMACGCNVITNNFAVMAERSPLVTTNESFKDCLIDILKNPKEKKDTKKIIENNSWKSVALDWEKNIFPIPIDTEVIHRLDWIRESIKRNKETVIDIGSNKGHTFHGWDRNYITSVDVDKYEIPNFIQANAENLPLENKKYDIAVLGEVIEHSKEPIQALKEAKRVARKVLITVPYEYEWRSDLKPFNTYEKEKARRGLSGEELAQIANPAKEFHKNDFDYLYHERFYTPELLEEHLREAGFTDFKIIKLRHKEVVWLGAIANG